MSESRPEQVRNGGETPFVSVVIPAYNCRLHVRAAIDSVLAQTFTDYEVIVVNDASTDDTPQILAEYESAGRIRVVTHEQNRGLAAARNTGIGSSRGRYVSFLDADDLWRPGKLSYHVGILEQHADIMFLSSDSVWFRDGERPVFPPLPTEPELRPVEWRTLLLGSSPFSGSNAIVRRECFGEVGLFDESLRAAEDRDMWLRIARRFGTTFDSAQVDAYRRHSGSMTTDPHHMKPNVLRVLAKTFRNVPTPWPLRARAYAHTYLELVLVCYDAGMRFEGLRNLAASFWAWPLPLGREIRKTPLVRLVWLVKTLLGKRAFEALWKPIARLLGRPARTTDGGEPQ